MLGGLLLIVSQLHSILLRETQYILLKKFDKYHRQQKNNEKKEI